MGHGHGFADGVIYPEVEPPASTMVDKASSSGPPFAAEDVAPTRKVLAQHIITMPKRAVRLLRTTNARASRHNRSYGRSTACRAAKGIAADQTRIDTVPQKRDLSLVAYVILGTIALLFHFATFLVGFSRIDLSRRFRQLAPGVMYLPPGAGSQARARAAMAALGRRRRVTALLAFRMEKFRGSASCCSVACRRWGGYSSLPRHVLCNGFSVLRSLPATSSKRKNCWWF
jgi:hypothetical protein